MISVGEFLGATRERERGECVNVCYSYILYLTNKRLNKHHLTESQEKIMEVEVWMTKEGNHEDDAIPIKIKTSETLA